MCQPCPHQHRGGVIADVSNGRENQETFSTCRSSVNLPYTIGLCTLPPSSLPSVVPWVLLARVPSQVCKRSSSTQQQTTFTCPRPFGQAGPLLQDSAGAQVFSSKSSAQGFYIPTSAIVHNIGSSSSTGEGSTGCRSPPTKLLWVGSIACDIALGRYWRVPVVIYPRGFSAWRHIPVLPFNKLFLFPPFPFSFPFFYPLYDYSKSFSSPLLR